MITTLRQKSTTAAIAIGSLMCAVLPVFAMLPTAKAAGLPHSVTYYLSPNGNNANGGTSPTSPWRTLGELNSTTLVPGDRILLDGGATFDGSLTIKASGISVSSYGDGAATIDAGEGGGIFVYDSGQISINNLNIKGSGPSSNNGYGVKIYSDLPGSSYLHNIALSNLTVTGFKWGGIVLGADNGSQVSGYDAVSITDCHVEDNGVVGIETWGLYQPNNRQQFAFNNVVVRHCVANNNVGVAGYPNHSGDGILLGQVDHGLITDSVAYDNGADNTHVGGPVGIWTWDSNDVTISYNKSFDNETNSAADGGGFDLDGGVTGSVLEDNIAWGNAGAGYMLDSFQGSGVWDNNIVRDNLSIDNGLKNSYPGLMIWAAPGQTVNNATVINNVFVAAPAPTGTPAAGWIYMQGMAHKVAIEQNLILSKGGMPLITTKYSSAPITGIQFANNAFGSHGSFQIEWNNTMYTSLRNWEVSQGQLLTNTHLPWDGQFPITFEGRQISLPELQGIMDGSPGGY